MDSPSNLQGDRVIPARHLWLSFKLLVSFAGIAEALEGRVVDGRSGNPVAGAEVTIVAHAPDGESLFAGTPFVPAMVS